MRQSTRKMKKGKQYLKYIRSYQYIYAYKNFLKINNLQISKQHINNIL